MSPFLLHPTERVSPPLEDLPLLLSRVDHVVVRERGLQAENEIPVNRKHREAGGSAPSQA